MCEHVFVAVTDLPSTQLCDVRAIEVALHDIVGSFDADAVFVFEAPELFAAFDAVERLASAAKTLLARRVDEAAMWRRAGYRSSAEQMAAISGTSVVSARSMLETSKQLDELPATADALRAGVLSFPKVEAIASAATIAPDAEVRLLEAANLPLAELRDQSLRAKAVDRDAAYERIRRARRAHEYTNGEGAWNFVACGTVDAGARFRFAYDPIVDEMFEAARAEGRTEPREAYAFDALIELARRASSPVETPDGPVRKTSPRFYGLIRADLEALQRGSVEGDEVCEIAGLGPIPVRIAGELLGESILELVLTKGVDVGNVTHLGRSATVAQQVALWWRSPTCTNEDCTRSRRLENDHREDWARTHHTRLDELDPLCGHDHDLKTHCGWALVAGTGKRPLVPPDDPRHPNFRQRPPPEP